MQNPVRLIHFLHDFSPDTDYQNGLIISLYPKVSYQLEQAKIAYKTLDDFYDDNDLFKRGEELFKSFAAWLDRFDAYLLKCLPVLSEYKTRPAKFHASEFKYLADELWNEAFILKSFLSKQQKPVRIRYHRIKREPSEYSARHYLRTEKNNFLLPLLNCIASQNPDITVEECEIPGTRNTPTSSAPEKPKAALKRSLKSFFLLSRNIFRFFHYQKWRYGLSLKPRTVLALSSGAFQIDEIIRGFIRKKWRVLVLSEDRILDISDCGEKNLLDLNQKSPGNTMGGVEEILRDVPERTELFEFFEKETSLPVKGIVLPFLDYFISHTLPQFISHIKSLDAFFKKYPVELVISTHSAGILTKSALASASLNGIPRVCFQHGIHAYRDPLIFLTDLDPFDDFFATESLSEALYRDQENIPIKKCRVHLSTHYLNRIRNKYSFRKQTKSSAQKLRILYVPTKVISYRRSLSVPTYSVNWYYNYQKRLLDLFRDLNPIQFIYKGANTDWRMSYDSIIPYFQNRREYGNVSLETGRLATYLPKVDGVIIDRPTTTLFEADAAGVPYLCLMHQSVSYGLDPLMKSSFQDTLAIFQTLDEALNTVKKFVRQLQSLTPKSKRLEPFSFEAIYGTLVS